jgi:hypothetical protein
MAYCINPIGVVEPKANTKPLGFKFRSRGCVVDDSKKQ